MSVLLCTICDEPAVENEPGFDPLCAHHAALCDDPCCQSPRAEGSRLCEFHFDPPAVHERTHPADDYLDAYKARRDEVAA